MSYLIWFCLLINVRSLTIFIYDFKVSISSWRDNIIKNNHHRILDIIYFKNWYSIMILFLKLTR